jgi:hypothetical protein
MNNLFTLLLLLSLLGLIIGLVKPSIIKLDSRKKVLYIFGGSTILCFILFGVTSNSIPTPTQTTSTTAVAQTPEVKKVETKPVQKEKTLEEKITDAVNQSLGAKTNTKKRRVVSVAPEQYNDKVLAIYKYKKGEKVLGVLIKINSDENITTNLQKRTMHDEAAKIAQAVFPLDQTIGDIVIWSQLPVKDQYGNVKDDTAIVYSISRSLFSKINWNNFDGSDLPELLKSESATDDRNNYYENIQF